MRGSAPADSDNAGACFVNGLLLEGQLVVAPGNLGQLGLAHCTVIPGRGALTVQAGGNERLGLAIDRSICAAIGVPDPLRTIEISDSIVGDDSGSPDLSVDAPQTPRSALRTQLLRRRQSALSLSASDCIFDGRVEAAAPSDGLRALQLRAARLGGAAALPLPARPRDCDAHRGAAAGRAARGAGGGRARMQSAPRWRH